MSRSTVLALLAALIIIIIAACGTTEPSPQAGTGPPTTPAAATRTDTPSPAVATQTPTPAAPTTPPATPQRTLAQVLRAIDGDTIEVAIDGQAYTLRYIGIDTPETVHPSQPVECFGQEASAFNKNLVQGKQVELEKDVSETDRFGRLLRYVYIDGQMVNETLVREGYAVSSTFPPDVKYQDRFLQAQTEARDANRGLWAACGGADTPLVQPTLAPPAQAGDCEPSYPDVCIPIGSADYDCAGGSGNGPNYIRGPIRVLPPDPYDLDRDGDGIGCE